MPTHNPVLVHLLLFDKQNLMGGEGVGRRLGESWRNKKKRFNEIVSSSRVGKYFKLQHRKSSFTTEVRAGTATFLTMVYIIVVNATILTDSGGTCTISNCPMTETADCKLKSNIDYENCLSKTKSDLIVATALSSMIGCFAMGILANLPFALAPGMGVNAYFAYSLVGFHGSGHMTYHTALAVCLLQGIAFLAIALLGLRGKLARLLPRSIRLASAAGVGLFIAFTGLQVHQGIGLIGPSSSTLLSLTACSSTNPETGACVDGVLQSPTFWLGILSFLIICYGLINDLKGSMIYGLIFVTLVSWVRGTSFTIFPYTTLGTQNFEYFKKGVDFHTIKTTAGAISFNEFNRGDVWLAVLTLLYVEVFGTTSVLYSMAEIGGFMDENGGFEGEYSAFMVDAGATIIGSALGTSPIATYVESSAGIKEGGRTGLTAVIVGFYFLLSLFFTPILVSVPPWAIGPSLVMVGVMMIKVVKDIEWENVKEGVPAFVTMLLMPLTYNISYGIIGGIGMYVALHLRDYFVSLQQWLVQLKVIGGAKNQVSAATSHDQDSEIV